MPKVIHTIDKPHGVTVKYLRDDVGTVTRTVTRKKTAKKPAQAPKEDA